MSEYYGKGAGKPEKLGIIGRAGIIHRSDNIIGLGDMEKAWHVAGKLRFVARHKRFPDDPRVTFIVQSAIPLHIIKHVLFEVIGAESPAAYQKAIDEVYGKPVDENTPMFLHFGDFK